PRRERRRGGDAPVALARAAVRPRARAVRSGLPVHHQHHRDRAEAGLMRAPRAAAVAFLLGFAMMALELTAVRLLAPYFGDSAYVWTNVIGVMLVALAAGAWLGGATAGRPDAQRWLGIALLCAAVLAALAPWCARPLGGWLVPQDLPLEAATAALVRGSLFATLVLFAPPVLLLGCAGPMLVAALA